MFENKQTALDCALAIVENQSLFIQRQSETLKRAVSVIERQSAVIKKLQSKEPEEVVYFEGFPSRRGIYHVSIPSLKGCGGALGVYDGTVWKKFNNWGDMTNRGENILWYGEGEDRRQPITDPDLLCYKA